MSFWRLNVLNLYIFTILNAQLFPEFEDTDTDVLLYVGVIYSLFLQSNCQRTIFIHQCAVVPLDLALIIDRSVIALKDSY